MLATINKIASENNVRMLFEKLDWLRAQSILEEKNPKMARFGVYSTLFFWFSYIDRSHMAEG